MYIEMIKNLLRAKSCVTEAIELDHNYSKKYPLLLRNKSLFINSIILFTYEQVYHGSVGWPRSDI